jgi:hypothetical protein
MIRYQRLFCHYAVRHHFQLLPPQNRVRSSPDFRNHGDGAEHVRFVPDEQAQQGLYKDAVYSMTSSARAINVGGIVMPSAFAVLRLITSSNFVGCSTGKSAGFAPLRILSYKPHRGNAARLRANEIIQRRTAEILGKAAEKAEVNKAWVIERLKETVERAMQAVPHLDGCGRRLHGVVVALCGDRPARRRT